MDFTKFMYLLMHKKLFFCRADFLGDPYEGSYPKINRTLRPSLLKSLPDMSEEGAEIVNTQFTEFAKGNRRRTFVNCWHSNEHESAAMWKLYSRTDEAVAVETDYFTLSENLPDSVFLSLVKYIDYESEWFPEDNMLYPYIHKRKSFEHEREVRAIHLTYPHQQEKMGERMSDGVRGIDFDCDVSALIRRVHVSPTSPDWFKALVEGIVKRFGFSFEVKKSLLNEEPLF